MQSAAELRNNTAATTHARRFLLLLGLIVFVCTLGSLYFYLNGIDKKYKTLAAELGRSFFQAVDTMREWNLDQGGIYVEVSEDTQPNPYLAESLRTLTTADGKVLAMINHAQMTRLFSELLTHKRGIHLHISSLTPIRPDNLADRWEEHVLAHFARDSVEEFDIVGDGDDSVFRYMAPLRVEERCLTCHPRQADSPSHLRGGISVSFSYVPFRKAMEAERRHILLIHGMFFILGVGLIALTGRKMIHSIAALQDALLQVKRLEGFLPICSRCKKIRLGGSDHRDQQSWIAVETYIQDRTDAEFTHGLCPQCAKKLYPDFFHDPPR
jgi:hypothetical protein